MKPNTHTEKIVITVEEIIANTAKSTLTRMSRMLKVMDTYAKPVWKTILYGAASAANGSMWMMRTKPITAIGFVEDVLKTVISNVMSAVKFLEQTKIRLTQIME